MQPTRRYWRQKSQSRHAQPAAVCSHDVNAFYLGRLAQKCADFEAVGCKNFGQASEVGLRLVGNGHLRFRSDCTLGGPLTCLKLFANSNLLDFRAWRSTMKYSLECEMRYS